MATVEKHESKPGGVFDRLDRLFEDWTGGGTIRVDEFHEGDTLVVRAELPGIDPDKDVEVTLVDDTLRIQAERRAEETIGEKGYVRRELRYGSFTRTLPLPPGASEADVEATYENGILEIRVPMATTEAARRIPVRHELKEEP